MAVLSADLIPYLTRPKVSVILAQIENVDQGDDPVVQTGIVHLRVLELLNAASVAVGDMVRVPFERMTQPPDRNRNAPNHWNVLPLSQGGYLILACSAMGGDARGLAARGIVSPTSEVVSVVREIYRVERMPIGDQKNSMLQSGLTAEHELMRYYSIDAITRRHLVNRDVAASMLQTALSLPGLGEDTKEALGEAVGSEYVFDEDRGQEPVNVLVIGTLAKQFSTAMDPEPRSFWVNELASTLFSEFADDERQDSAIRTAVVRAVSEPSSAAMIKALADYSQEVREDDQEIARELLGVWQAAQ